MKAVLKWLRLAPLALVSTLFLADVEVDASTSELAFEYAGCARVRPQRVCELGPERDVVLWVAGAGAVEVRDTLGNASEVRESTQVEGGLRIRVRVAPNTRALELRSGGKRGFLALHDSTEPARLRHIDRLWKGGNWEEVRRLLGERDPLLSAADTSRLRAFEARLALRAGDNEHAASELEATAENARSSGLLLEASNDLAAAAYCRAVRLRQYQRARNLLESARDLESVPEIHARFSYYSAVVANASGDLLGALTQFRTATVLARRIDLLSDELFARQELAVTLNRLHRHAEAIAEQKELILRGLDAPGCVVAERWEKLSWLLLSQPESKTKVEEATAALDRAERLLTHCPDPLSERNHALNRVELALQLRDVAKARAGLEALEANSSPASTLLAAWQARDWGELHLLEGAPVEAVRWFERAESLAQSVELRNVVYLARLGRARALAARHDEAAISAYWSAENAADAVVRAVPFGQGRELTALDSQQSSRELLSLLLSRSRVEEARKAAIRAARRSSFSSWQATRVRALGPAQRARWERAVSEYRARRQHTERASNDDWKLSRDGLRAVQLSRAVAVQQMENALAAVNALVGNRDASGELRTDDEDAHLLIAGAYDGFWAFVWQGQRLQVAYLSPTESDPAASAELRARLARCLETFLSDVSVPLLRVTLPAELAELDVHAMSVGGRALIERVPVAYTLEPSSSPKGDVGAGASADSVVVIGNPSGDLPRSEVEATDVAERFPGSQLLLGNQASRSALSSQLTNAHLLHFAGHGRAGGVDGTDSALMLSADQFLALGDVLALGHVPEFVVLSACSSGLSTDRGAGLSIGQAFVLAGAQAVIAAGRAISDSESERFTRALYDHLLGAEGSHTLPSGSHAWAAALRATALEFQGDPATDWASVRLLLP